MKTMIEALSTKFDFIEVVGQMKLTLIVIESWNFCGKTGIS